MGLGDVITEQTLALATEYGLNLLAALATIIIGIWASRRFSSLLRDWLGKSTLIDRPCRSWRRLSICHPDPYRGRDISTLGDGNLDHRRPRCGRPCHRPGAPGYAFQRRRRADAAVPAALQGWRLGGGRLRVSSVREIKPFTTTIDTFDNVFISVPNSAIWTSNTRTMPAMAHAAWIWISASARTSTSTPRRR